VAGPVISLTICGNALGQFILVPLFTSVIAHYDWRTASLGIAVIMFVINMALALFVIRGEPKNNDLILSSLLIWCSMFIVEKKYQAHQ
jgi:TRAP-type uncharacterized transport system fused permease subunit